VSNMPRLAVQRLPHRTIVAPLFVFDNLQPGSLPRPLGFVFHKDSELC
jgi:hypothetical protein